MATKKPELKELWRFYSKPNCSFSRSIRLNASASVRRQVPRPCSLRPSLLPFMPPKPRPDMSGGSRGAGGTVANGGIAYSCAICLGDLLHVGCKYLDVAKKLGYESSRLRRYKLSAIFL